MSPGQILSHPGRITHNIKSIFFLLRLSAEGVPQSEERSKCLVLWCYVINQLQLITVINLTQPQIDTLPHRYESDIKKLC